MERMTDFFAARVEGYDQHMLRDVEGCREAYARIATLIPADASTLLDLGAGTGLELDFILPHHPHLQVTAIDLTAEMLAELSKKHPAVTTVCSDYFATDFGVVCYDAAVSVESMHHFEKEKKLTLYRRVKNSLKDGGVYIECDYMVETQAEEDRFFAECRHQRKEMGLPDDSYYHCDTPCTVDNQIQLLKDAGFDVVEHLFRQGGTSVLIAR